ncbi:glycerol uptake operon antiterminator [Heyndrickxia sporothermodurans]|nr:glycerol uptake operon antiterminator [Heyndrickxia sporothermodurans]
MNNWRDSFHIIPSIRRVRDLSYALTLNTDYILLSETHIGNLKTMVGMCHKANKKVIVNMELVGGLNTDKVGIKLLNQLFNVDIVIGSGSSKVNMAKSLGLTTIHRVTLMDSKSLDTAIKSIGESKTDLIELRPGIYGIKYINTIKQILDVPMILGGFVDNKDILNTAREAGFSGVATSSKDLWKLTTK